MLLHLAALLSAASSTPPPNDVVVVVIDDMGIETLAQYGVPGGTDLETPTLDRLIAEGVLFTNAYSHPVCSPARAALLSGRHAFRTGMGDALNRSDQPPLDHDEVLLPELLELGAPGLWSTLAVGKWHLAEDPGDAVAQGFDAYLGVPLNLHGALACGGTARGGCGATDEAGYGCHCKTIARAGSAPLTRLSDTYVTSETVDDALHWIEARHGEPWFAYVALHAPHRPWHEPPVELAPRTPPAAPGATLVERNRRNYAAMVEALDTELGRLIGRLDPSRTTVFVLADNGTPSQVAGPPFAAAPGLRPRGKNTVYQGGVNVPLVVWGADVAPSNVGGVRDELVQVLDLFATVAEIAGIDAPQDLLPPGRTLDSISFLHLLHDAVDPQHQRTHAYSERFDDGDPDRFAHRTLRDARYKLVRRTDHDGDDELYDLQTDRWEDDDLYPLLQQGADPELVRAYRELVAELEALLGS